VLVEQKKGMMCQVPTGDRGISRPQIEKGQWFFLEKSTKATPSRTGKQGGEDRRKNRPGQARKEGPKNKQ